MTILVQQQLREAAREIANWSGSLTDTWVSSQASYMCIVGCIDEDDQKYPVVRIEADAYGHQGESEKLAEFMRLANPKSVLALLDEIDRLEDALHGASSEVHGLSAQHGRDSAELRRLCQARDDARKERDRLKAENATLLGALQETNHCLVACLTGGEVSAKRAGKAIEAAAIAIDQAMTKEQQA